MSGAYPPSPCISLCKIAPLSGLCQGCKRSRDEIKAWRDLSKGEKLDLLEELARR